MAYSALMATVLVCGGRDFDDYEWLRAELARLVPAGSTVVHGGATGADALANRYAEENGLAVRAFPADWESFGLAAGPIRNSYMLREAKPDLVVAFRGGRGTADMVRRARAAGVPVVFSG